MIFYRFPLFSPAREQPMSSPIAFREFSKDEYRKFMPTLSDEELIEAGKRSAVCAAMS
jgi:hypothetical protein